MQQSNSQAVLPFFSLYKLFLWIENDLQGMCYNYTVQIQIIHWTVHLSVVSSLSGVFLSSPLCFSLNVFTNTQRTKMKDGICSLLSDIFSPFQFLLHYLQIECLWRHLSKQLLSTNFRVRSYIFIYFSSAICVLLIITAPRNK